MAETETSQIEVTGDIQTPRMKLRSSEVILSTRMSKLNTKSLFFL